MTDKNLTEIVAILDRSGSMHCLTADTIGGFNAFLAEQKKAPGRAKLTLVQFDDQYQIDHDGVDIQSVPDLNRTTYQPRGSTALLDAVGKTIVTVGERLAKTPEEQRPGQVIFLVITDGQENASKEFRDPAKIAEMVRHQTENYQWTFSFMGGGNAAFAQAAHLGFASNQTYLYPATSDGTHAVYAAAAVGFTRRREQQTRGVIMDPMASLLTDDEAKSLKN